MTDITILSHKVGEEDDKGLEARLREEQLLEQSNRARQFFASLQTELDEIEGDIKDGLSYLDMKNDLLLSYMIDLCNIVLRKVRGEKISGHASVERCVTYRVILEKIKAIDQRIAYQINKVISLPEGASDENQAINVANLDVNIGTDEDDGSSDTDHEEQDGNDGNSDPERGKNMSAGSDEDDDDSDDEGEDDFDQSADENSDNTEGEKEDPEIAERLRRHQIIAAAKDKKNKKELSKKKDTGVYRPPKLRSVAYEEDAGSSSRGGRRRDYSEFYQDEDNGDIVEETRAQVDERRVQYEEDHYTRLPSDNPKRAKRKLKAKSGKKKKFRDNKRGGR